MWINQDGTEQLTKPLRVRLLDGTTKTNQDITEQDLIQSGWQYIEPESQKPRVVISHRWAE